MVYYVHAALIGCTVGVCVMKTITEFWKREQEKKILSRKKHFKYAQYNYWTKTMSDGSTEFWAYSCISEESSYLGKYEKGVITECDGFYAHALEWSVQKGATRLFDEFQNEQIS